MIKPRIAIDIDGTVTCPSTFVPYINNAFRKNLKYTDITQYELHKVYGIPLREFQAWLQKAEPVIYYNSPLVRYAKEVLQNWKRSFELFFISARGEEHLNVTKGWFKKHEVPYHYIDLLGKHHKVEAANKHEVSVFLEDRYENACEIAEECKIPVILFDTPYNQHPLPANVLRVYNWKQADILIGQLFQEYRTYSSI